MEEELIPYIEEYRIVVRRQYIDNEPELEQRYGSKVPVLTFNEETLCEYFLDPEVLLRVIADSNHCINTKPA